MKTPSSSTIIDFSLVSLKESIHLRVGRNLPFFEDLLLAFEHVLHEEELAAELKAVQRNSQEVRNNLEDLANKFGQKYPTLHKVRAFITGLKENQAFIIVNRNITDTKELLNYFKILAKINPQASILNWYSDEVLNLEILAKNFDISIFGHQRKTIGDRKNKIRTCRFCGCVDGEQNIFQELVSFRNKSHAISEALGNKTVFLLEECDNCNERFSRTIEPSLIALVSFHRTLYELKGKGGIKDIIGKNFELRVKDGNIHLKDFSGRILNKQSKSITWKLKSNENYTPQNIYRCLVKFALSVIDFEDLKYFKKTIEWVNCNFNALRLPKIAVLQHPDFFTSHPLLAVYKRKKDSPKYPFLVGEFHYADIVFTFIIPYCMNDKIGFIKEKNYNEYWQIFEKFRNSSGWKHKTFASNKKYNVNCNFKLNISEDAINTSKKLELYL